MKKFGDIILPLPIQPLTYYIPLVYQNRIDIGSIVLVPLRSGNLLLGIVMRCHEKTPTYPTRDLLALVYEKPLFSAQQLNFLASLADYYLSNVGTVLSLAWPRLFRFPHGLAFKINKTANNYQLSTIEQLIYAALQYKSLAYPSITQLTDQKQANKALMALLAKGLVEAFITIKINQQDRDNCYFALSPTIQLDPLSLSKLLARSPKQQAIIRYFLDKKEKSTLYTSKKELIAYSKSALDTLLKKEVLIKVNPDQPPISIFTTPLQPLAILTAFQEKARIAIEEQFTNKNVVLLHGTIGSGKTEIYMHLIASTLRRQKQVLLLLPEIGLATHIVERIKPLWGEWLIVYHSKQSHKERLNTWLRLLQEEALLVVGTRSALLLPFKALQLIIIDEEHDHAYKQTDAMPTYHARESSILLAQKHQAKVLLASGTPSLETYYNAKSKKFGLVTLDRRFGTASSPQLFFIDLNIEKRRKAMREHFSLILLSKLKKNYLEGGQAIIFQNRRGYAQYFLCAACGWIPRCRTCSVSLTYHQEANHLCCHYCDYNSPPLLSCDDCGSEQLHNIGFGTEKLEESLQLIFPKQQIARIDLDSTKRKNSYQSILNNVKTGSIDILVGTQMIAKGLDFPKINLIGILDIDSLLYFPDFRANEKCFQLITQLAGRAGRRNQQGSVFIQTRQTHHPLFAYLANADYEGMYKAELTEREGFCYPPYARLIKISLRCINPSVLESGAIRLKKLLAKEFKGMVLGPQQPLVSKIRNYFLLDLFLKIPTTNLTRLQWKKQRLASCCSYVLGKVPYKQIKMLLDIDPI